MYENNLNYFRGLFASIIVFLHMYQILFMPLYYEKDSVLLKVFQSLGLDIVGFFVLISGYSIAFNLHSNYLKNDNNLNIWIFVKSRFKRVFPPLLYSFLIIIFVVFIVKYFGLNGSEFYKLTESKYVPREKVLYDLDLIMYNLFFLPSVIFDISTPTMNGPLWSINFEVFFYLLSLCMFVFFTVKTDYIKIFLSIIILSLIIIFQFIYKDYVNISFLYFFFFFCLGMISYFVKYNKLIDKHYLIKILLILTIILVSIIFYDIELFIPYKGTSSYNIMTIIMIYAILIYTVFFSNNKKLYFDTLFTSISKYAYTLYILHFPLLLFSLSIFHKILYEVSKFEFALLLMCIFFIIFKFCKYSSYIVERKNYK